MTIKLLLFSLLFQLTLLSCGQNKKPRTILGDEFAKVELEQSITDSTLHNVVDGKVELIPDRETAIGVAEKILFRIYGQKNIEDQRPYEIYKIKNFWSISGTLPKGTLGGTFLIIIDSRDSRVVRLTHGK